jgi:hypothetical protein
MGAEDEGKGKSADGSAITNEQMMQALRFIHTEIKRVEGKIDAGAKPPSGNDSESDEGTGAMDESALERMSRVDFGKFLAGNIMKTLEKSLLKPLNERLDSMETNFDRYKATKDVEQASKSLKNFDKWTDEIKQVLEKHPSLSVDEAYALAQTVNPKKADELSSAERAAAEKAEQEKKQAERRSFGGLLPTSGLTARNDKMNPQEAAEAAFDELLPGVRNIEDMFPEATAKVQ